MGCMGSKIFPDREGKVLRHCLSDKSDLYTEKNKPQERPKIQKNPNVLKGDVTLKNESRMLRERTFKERMLRRTSAAEEISGRIMDERERLSLGTRSRATSRATSRTGSPVGTSRRQVHFKPEDRSDLASSNSSKQGKGGKIKRSALSNSTDGTNGVVISHNGNTVNQSELNPEKRQKDDQSEQASQNPRLTVQPMNTEDTKNNEPPNASPEKSEQEGMYLQKPTHNHKYTEKTDLNQNMSETLTTIEERASSRSSEKLETEAKRG